jgi:hypothetical protein
MDDRAFPADPEASMSAWERWLFRLLLSVLIGWEAILAGYKLGKFPYHISCGGLRSDEFLRVRFAPRCARLEYADEDVEILRLTCVGTQWMETRGTAQRMAW